MKRLEKFKIRHKRTTINDFSPLKSNFNVGDMVIVITGNDKKKTGKIERIVRKSGHIKVKIEGIAKNTHFTKDGILQKERLIDISNIKYLDENIACRIIKKKGGIRFTNKGKEIPVKEWRKKNVQENNK